MMQFFNVDVDDFEIWPEHGAAAGVKTWSESRVSGSGGNNNTPVRVSTHVTTRNEFFLVDGEKESAISLNGAVPLRDGQLASVVYVRRRGKQSGYAVLFKNQASGDERTFNGVIDAAGGSGCAVLILALLGGGILGWMIGGELLGFLGAAGLTTVTVMRNLKLRATSKQIIENARGLVAELKTQRS